MGLQTSFCASQDDTKASILSKITGANSCCVKSRELEIKRDALLQQNALEDPELERQKRALRLIKIPGDLEILGLLGRGRCGKVRLVRPRTQQYPLVALKTMKKLKLLKLGTLRHAELECTIQAKLNHPFIVHLLRKCEDSSKMYMLLCWVDSMAISKVLMKYGVLQEAQACSVVGELTLALEYLKSMHVIHRDVKPENILLSHRGHVKLGDFGLATQLRTGEKTYTVCGTTSYMAPEMIRKTVGYDYAVDWWSLGIVLFHVLTGFVPFSAPSRSETQLLIVACDFVCPATVPVDARDLITRLLDTSVEFRCGCRKADARDVKTHNWFVLHQFDWSLGRGLFPSFLFKDVDFESLKPDGKVDSGSENSKSSDEDTSGLRELVNFAEF